MLRHMWSKRLLIIYNQSNLVKHLIVAPILVISTWSLGRSLGLNIGSNVYGSVPYKWFITLKRIGNLKYGQYVIFQQAVNGIQGLLVKKIIGIPGDQIIIDQDDCWVGDKYVGKAKKFSKEGRELYPMQIQVIPQKQYFVAGTSPDSFDSRYKEIGLIEESRILFRAFPLW